VLLEQHDRARWDHAAIGRGRAALARAEQAGRGLGAYGLQAAIAEWRLSGLSLIRPAGGNQPVLTYGTTPWDGKPLG
jgi:hypothetical protein